MDIDNLKAFLAVAAHKSFSLAAEKLFLTQPAVSKRIDRLEEELAYSLFDRVGRQIVLTEAGRTLQPYAQQILNQLQLARESIDNLGDEVSGELKLVTSHHIGLYRLPPLMKTFIQGFERIRLYPEFQSSERALQGVELGKYELGVTTLPERLPEKLVAIPLWDDELVYVCASEHPLAEQENLSPSALLGYPAILPAKGSFTRQLIDENFGHQSKQIDDALSSNFLQTNKMMASVGIGWSVLPSSMLDSTLSVLTLDTDPMYRQLGLISHRSRSLSRAAKAFMEHLTASNPFMNR